MKFVPKEDDIAIIANYDGYHVFKNEERLIFFSHYREQSLQNWIEEQSLTCVYRRRKSKFIGWYRKACS